MSKDFAPSPKRITLPLRPQHAPRQQDNRGYPACRANKERDRIKHQGTGTGSARHHALVAIGLEHMSATNPDHASADRFRDVRTQSLASLHRERASR
ncbi:MAG: hypothetical protein ABF968_04740 [Acetobacter sp.]|uniref:hypothetical protein n=1 Tax=Acetobacter sp. TaxID=440 RepID=UPI0039EBF940